MADQRDETLEVGGVSFGEKEGCKLAGHRILFVRIEAVQRGGEPRRDWF